MLSCEWFTGVYTLMKSTKNIDSFLIQDLFHVFLNNFEMAIFLLFFKLFIIFFLRYARVIFKKREPLIKLFFKAFLNF